MSKSRYVRDHRKRPATINTGQRQMTYEEIMLAQEEGPPANPFVAAYIETRARSYHETGHAVIGYIAGFGCEFITVDLNHPKIKNEEAIGGMYYKSDEGFALLQNAFSTPNARVLVNARTLSLALMPN